MTESEADYKVKLLLDNPFARAVERETQLGYSLRFYVGWSARYGMGRSWEEAFENIKAGSDHALTRGYRMPRRTFAAAMFRAKRDTLRERWQTR